MTAIDQLIDYAVDKGLIDAGERRYRANLLYAAFCPDGALPRVGVCPNPGAGIQTLLDYLCDCAVELGRIENAPAARDRFDTLLMGLLTPAPGEVNRRFEELYRQSPETATDWFYRFCADVNYIRAGRVARDERWTVQTPYGGLMLSINLAKPEKDPRDIAAAGAAGGADGYPACALCAENEGYAGRAGHPARQNLRVIPIAIAGQAWGLQYSPYVYYNEHCIVLNQTHVPMAVDGAVFGKLLDFVELFPFYFVGSNADLPIVGGSILSHEHFQGGRCRLPMEAAGIGREIFFPKTPQVRAGVVKWPMATLRLRSCDRVELEELCAGILAAWRGYTDEQAMIFAKTGDTPHNTITPVARRRGGEYEIDLIFRNNLTTPEHPLGLYHPHAELHHIKKENIGLIEAQGLAILPARLSGELALLREAFLTGADLRDRPETALHADWFEEEVRPAHPALDATNFDAIIRREVGRVFQRVLEDAGVFTCDAAGQRAFDRFLTCAGAQVAADMR